MSIHPTLYLFSYDLRAGLGQSESLLQEKREEFKHKLSQLPDEFRQQIDKRDISGEVAELLQDRVYEFYEAICTGFYYPVRLHDSYGLLIDCSCREAQSLDNFQWVTELKASIYQKLAGKPPTLGQTWVIYASVPGVRLQDYDTIAQKCYQTLLPNANWDEDKTGTSTFSDGKLFEFWQEMDETVHVVIMLFSSEQARADYASTFIENEMRRFLYCHKIVRAHAQSQDLKRILETNSIEIDKLLDESSKEDRNDDISEILKKANSLFRSYVELLNGLAAQIPTIETNLLNYRKWTGKLAQSLPGMNFPNEFERRTTEKYLPQIQRDQATFTLQLDLIKNLVASIQAQGVHDSLKQIADVQRKVEWLEVFFVSFYAAEFAHIILELSHKVEKEPSGIEIVVFAAFWAGLTSFFGLKLWKDFKFDLNFVLTVVLVVIGLAILFCVIN